MVGDAGEHVGKVMLRVEAVELGTFNQRIDRGGAAATGIGAGKQIIFTANGDAAQGTLGGIVVECQAAIVEAAHQCSPARPHVAEGLGEFGFARELAHSAFGPGRQGFGNRFRAPLSFLSSPVGQ